LSEVLGINTKTGDALGIAKQLGEVEGIKVGLSLIFSNLAARRGGVNEISFS
jgi:hypothetical protein